MDKLRVEQNGWFRKVEVKSKTHPNFRISFKTYATSEMNPTRKLAGGRHSSAPAQKYRFETMYSYNKRLYSVTYKNSRIPLIH